MIIKIVIYDFSKIIDYDSMEDCFFGGKNGGNSSIR